MFKCVKQILTCVDPPPVQLVGVSEIQNPPGYNPLTKESDLALLRLQTPLVFNSFVRPIDLWMSPLPLFSECTITGWGSTRESEGVFMC